MLRYVEMCSSERNYSDGLILAMVWVQRRTDDDLCIDLCFVAFHASCILEIGVGTSTEGRVFDSKKGTNDEFGFREEPSSERKHQ